MSEIFPRQSSEQIGCDGHWTMDIPRKLDKYFTISKTPSTGVVQEAVKNLRGPIFSLH